MGKLPYPEAVSIQLIGEDELSILGTFPKCLVTFRPGWFIVDLHSVTSEKFGGALPYGPRARADGCAEDVSGKG